MNDAQDEDSDRLFIYGGRNSAGKPLNDLWMFDAALGSLLEVPISEAQAAQFSPPPIYGHACVAHDYELDMFGGLWDNLPQQ